MLGTGPRQARQLISAIAVMLAIAIMVGGPSTDLGASTGAAWGLLSAVFLALRNVLSRRAVGTSPPLQIAFYQYAVATTCGASLGWSALPDIESYGVLLVLLGVGFTAIPHTLLIRSLATVTATRVGLIACLQPVYAATLAWLILSEQPSTSTLVGGSIVVGVALAATRRG